MCGPLVKATFAATSFHSFVASEQSAVVTVQSWDSVTPTSMAPPVSSDQ